MWYWYVCQEGLHQCLPRLLIQRGLLFFFPSLSLSTGAAYAQVVDSIYGMSPQEPGF